MARSDKLTTSRKGKQGGARDPSQRADAELGAHVWELTLRTVTGLLRTFEEDMKAEGFSLSWYDVLIQLSTAPEGRLRMQDLADGVVLTRSGLSRLVDRMESAGLVRREPAPHDRRGSYAVLTEQGRTTYARLAVDHHRSIEERFTRRLTSADLRALRRAMRKLGIVVSPGPVLPEG